MLNAVWVSLIAGVGGTGLGGVVALCLGRGKGVQSVLFALTAGIMLSIVCFELIPGAIGEIDVITLCISVMVGAVVIWLIESLFPSSNEGGSALFLVGLAIALHNMPEGLALGAGMRSESFSALSLLIGLHNIPEGMAVALPYIQKKKSAKGVMLSALSGAPTVIGAVAGALFSGISPVLSAVSLAFAGGAMIFVVFSELIPRSNDLLKAEFSGIILTVGIILGLIVINFL